jgi:hypothetical protein
MYRFKRNIELIFKPLFDHRPAAIPCNRCPNFDPL